MPWIHAGKGFQRRYRCILFTFDHPNLFCYEKSGSSGIINLGYNHFVADWLKLGISGSYVSYTTSKDYEKSGEPTRSVKWRDEFITIMARMDFHYVKKENVSMYSGVSAGVSFTSTKTLSGEANIELGNNTLFA